MTTEKFIKFVLE